MMARFRPDNTCSRVSKAALCGVVTGLLVAIGMLALALQHMPQGSDGHAPRVPSTIEDMRLSSAET